MSELFLAHVGPPRERFGPAAALEADLQALWRSAREAWPKVDLSAEVFLAHLAARLTEDESTAVLDDLRATSAGDLYLACACAQGDQAAIAEFEKHYMSQVSLYLARQDALPGFTDEVKQSLRARLLVGGDDVLRPRIASYSGRGPLGGWLRMAAARAAVDLRRERARDMPTVPASDDIAEPSADPELGYLKAQYGTELRQALEATLAALSPREATIVRLHFQQGMNTVAIGGLFGASERTARRWVADARAKIVKETKRRLGDRLKIPAADLESIVRLLREDLQPSVLEILDRPRP